MKTYTLYIMNRNTGSCRRVVMTARDVRSARNLYEKTCLGFHEHLTIAYPADKEPLR